MPVLAMFVLGVITWGLWLGMAHDVQQAANEGARAALEGLNATDRTTLVSKAVASSAGVATMVNQKYLTVSTALSGRNYTVTLTYDLKTMPFFADGLIPVPTKIKRSAMVQLYSS